MCGIAGILMERADGDARPCVERMTGALAHRGPDASGIWSDEFCTLGHRRLGIIDLSETGRQPLANEDGTIWVTFNGEIYNFQSLRQELIETGHQFRTGSAREVRGRLYGEPGVDPPGRLRGMFAFAIWDGPRRRLFAARDRLG